LLAQLFHISLAFLVLFSTSGLTVSKHYCSGVLKNVAIWAEAAPCHANKALKSCPLHADMTMPDHDTAPSNNCCDTRSEFFKTNTEQAEIATDFTLEDYPVVVAALRVLTDLHPLVNDSKTTRYLFYKPPLLVYDLPVSLQTFLC